MRLYTPIQIIQRRKRNCFSFKIHFPFSIIHNILNMYRQHSFPISIKILSYFKIYIFNISQAMFDQRMLRPSSDHFYFQLVPTTLTIKDKALAKKINSSNAGFRLKLLKGLQNCDQMKKGVSTTAPNGKITFEKAQLNFYLPSFNPNRDVEFTLILLQDEEGSDTQEIGRFSLMSSQYIIQFKQNQRKTFAESIQFTDVFQMNCEIYIDGTRFGLEKFVRQLKEGKQNQNVGDSSRKDNKPRSEALSSSSKGGVVNESSENRFMSPTRKIVRKQGDRKLLMRNSSPQRSQGGGSQTSSQRQRNLKFIGPGSPRKQSPPPKMSLAEEQINKIETNKRQIARKQALKKKQEDEKRRREQMAKQTAKQQAQNRRLQAQRKREEDQSRRAQEAERKRKQTERLAKQEQRKQKLEQSRRIREEENQRRKMTETSGGSRAINRNQLPKKNEQNASFENRHSRTSSANIKSNENSFSSNKLGGNTKKPSNQQQMNFDDILASSKKPVKTNYNWNEPVSLKRTDSASFDEQGNLIRSSVVSNRSGGYSKNRQPPMQMKMKVFLVVFMFISVLLIINAMKPSRKF